MKKTATPQLAHMFSVVGVLLVYLFTRVHDLMALPLFVDESIYVYRAQLVREGQIMRPVQHSRVLHAWLTAILGPYPPAGGWLARVAIVLVGVLAAAALYGLVRALVSHRAGVFALILWTATPYLFFYERMGLADSLLSVVSVIAVYVAWQMAVQHKWWLAVVMGLGLVAVLLAKASGTVWLPLPVVALVLATGVSWRKRIALAAVAYGTFGAIWGVFTVIMASRGVNYFGVAERFVGDSNLSFVDRVERNLRVVWDLDVAYIGLPVLLLGVFGALYWLVRSPRRALFALAALGMGGGAIVVGNQIGSSRYALNHVIWVVVLAAVGFELLYGHFGKWRPVLSLTAVVWIAVFFIPFMLTEWDDPADLPLIGNDVDEYVEHESSGFAVTEIGKWLSATDEPLPTLGLVSNCHALRITAYPVEVTCPTLYWNIENSTGLMLQAEEWAQSGPIYVVGEELDYLDLSALPQPNTLLATATRPGSGQVVSLFRIEQGAQRP